MLNTEITKTALREGMTYYCGYCAIQDAVRWLPEVGYNYGVYGWNCTVYACGRFALVTGYRPSGAYRLTPEECERLNRAPKARANDAEIKAAADLLGLMPEAVAVIAELLAIRADRRAAERAVEK